jgi:ribosomal protein L29
MEHPFINNLQDLSLEELQEKISELTKKLNFAYRMQNSPMIHQINMALESYRSEYSKKMDNLIKKQNINSQIKVEKK